VSGEGGACRPGGCVLLLANGRTRDAAETTTRRPRRERRSKERERNETATEKREERKREIYGCTIKPCLRLQRRRKEEREEERGYSVYSERKMKAGG
jgi:hypothetical protein